MKKRLFLLFLFGVFLIPSVQAKQSGAAALDEALDKATMQAQKKQQKLNESFNEAVSKNDWRRIQKLLTSGAQANSPQGTKALINACVKNDTNMMQQLLSAGASVNTQEGIDALIKTSLNGNKKGVENFLSAGVDINSIGLYNDIRDPRPRCGTALIWNIYYGNTDMVKFLLERGSAVEVLACGNTALLSATISSQPPEFKQELVNILVPYITDGRAAKVDRAAFWTVTMWDVFTPLFNLAERDGVDVTGVIQREGRTLLTELLYFGTDIPDLLSKVSFLIKKGMDVKVMDSEGDTALGVAIYYLPGQLRTQVVDLLLSAGALKGVDQETIDYTWETLAKKKKSASAKDMPSLLEVEQKIQQEIGPQKI